jgi:ribonuclease PH
MEIQRLIGRSLRAVADLSPMGERTILIDCDVLNADGGTRVASIIGAAVALHDAETWMLGQGMLSRRFLRELVAAVSVGLSNRELLVDLDQSADTSADVDMNVVMTESGRLVEVQGTAERATFSREELARMLDAAEAAIGTIIRVQREALEEA